MKRAVEMTIRVLAFICIYGAISLIVISAIRVAISDGLFAALKLFSPLNIVSWVVNILTLLPGILLFSASAALRKRWFNEE